MSDIIALARVDVSVGLSISDDGCSIGIVISFRINILMFASLPNNYSYKPSKTYTDRDANEYLKHCMSKLKKVYTDWERYMNENQESLRGRVFSSLDDVVEDAQKIIIRRKDFEEQIRKLIRDIDAEIPKYSQCSSKVQDSFLIMLSNCYQAFRDLTVTITIGEYSMEMDVVLNDEMVKLRNKYFSDSKYSNSMSMEKIKKRRSLSEQILETQVNRSTKRIEMSDYNAKLADVSQRLEEAKILDAKAEDVKQMLCESVEQCCADCKISIDKQISLAKAEIDKLVQKRNELEETAKKSAFGKKKLFAQKECVDRYIAQLEKECASLEERVTFSETEKEQRKAAAIEACRAINMLPALEAECKTLTEQKEHLDAEISSYDADLAKLEEEYTEFMKTWPVLS